MKHAIIYDRASTQKQVGNWSRRDAEITGFELARKHGFEPELRIEVESGESLHNRPVMREILNDIEAGLVGAIVVQNFSRLSRDMDGIDGRIIKAICRDNGCVVITPTMLYDFSNESHDDMADFQFLGAKLHKRNMIKFSLQGQKAKAKAGGYMGGGAPFGYELVYTQETEGAKPEAELAPNPKEAEIILKLFELYSEGISGGATARELNRLGYRKTLRQKNSIELHGKERPFTAADVNYIIQTPLYKGIVRWGTGTKKKSKYLRDFEGVEKYRADLQIVSNELWEKCHRNYLKRRIATPGARSNFAYAGILKCLVCGKKMHGMTPPNGNKRYRCAFCNKTITEKRATAAIIPKLIEILSQVFGFENIFKYAANTHGRSRVDDSLEKEIKTELAQVDQRMKRLTDSVSEGVLTLDEIRQSRDELRDKRERLERRLESLAKQDKIRQDFLRAIEVLQQANLEENFTEMLADRPLALKKILEMVFLEVGVKSTGGGRRWHSELVHYTLTEEIEPLYRCNLTMPGCLPIEITPLAIGLFELAA